MALRILSGILSLLFLYLGGLVYEDEHRALKNRIETLWLRLSYLHENSYVHETRLINRISVIYSSILDAIFGEKLVSLRSIASSTIISVGSTALLAIISRATSTRHPPLKGEIGLVGIGLAVACITALGVFLCRKHWLALVSLLIAPAPVFALYIYAVIASLHVHTLNVHNRKTWLGILLLFTSSYLSVLLSGLCDVVSVSVARGVFRAVLGKKSNFHWIAATLSCLAVITITFGFPVLISRMWLEHIGAARPAYLISRLSQFTLVVMELFNIDLFFLTGLMLSGAILILLHHVLWPPLLRGLYLVQDTGILSKRSLLLTMCLTFGVSAIWHPELIVKVIEKQIGIEVPIVPSNPSQGKRP